jgi:iterative type I PKS product template protein
MALTVGEHLYRRLVPDAKEVHVNVADIEVLESQMPHNDHGASAKPQLIQVEGDIDLTAGSTAIAWYTLGPDGCRSEHAFASATVLYEDAKVWKTEWRRITHLVTDRIATLSSMAATGAASRLSRSMVYQLFQNVVDYADRYRGMQSVVLHGLEAFADVELVADRHGSWHTPPHWIDSVFQMAGFVMNGSGETNTRDFFYITPGWADLRMASPLEAGTPYQSYVRMFPSKEEPNTYVGDIYALQAGEVAGVCGGIKFRKIPRVLMERLFSGGPGPSRSSRASSEKKKAVQAAPVGVPKPARRAQLSRVHVTAPPAAPSVVNIAPEQSPAPSSKQALMTTTTTPPPTPAVETLGQESGGGGKPQLEVVSNCLNLIAHETGLDVKDFVGDASFSELGIDSLMSLVLSEKLLKKLGVEVKSSIFLECPTVGEFTEWLTQYR